MGSAAAPAPFANILSVNSSAFENNGKIPSKYTCEGNDENPPLNIGNLPDNTRTLAIIVDDPNGPSGTFVHWAVWNIPVVDRIKENSIPGNECLNDFNNRGYNGPCPPRGSGAHEYHFKIYALDTKLPESGIENKNDLLKEMENHIIGHGVLVGTYQRKTES